VRSWSRIIPLLEGMVILEEPAEVAAVIEEAARTTLTKQQDELLTSHERR
jgi:hypothetical protein